MKTSLLVLMCAGWASAQQVDWIRQISNKPVYDVREYAWRVQRPGGTLAAGVPATFQLSPCPKGLNGTDQNDWILLSNPTEPFLITGGTCVSEGGSGTVSGTPISSHAAGWTAGPGASGVVQALQAAASAGGGEVWVPSGTYDLYAHLSVSSNVQLIGSSWATVFRVPDNQWPSANSGPFYDPANSLPVAIATVAGASGVTFRDFTLNMNGAGNANTQYGTSLALTGTTNSVVDHVQVTGAHHAGQAIGFMTNSGSNNRATNNYVHGFGGSVCAGGIFVQNPKFLVADNTLDALCDEALIANSSLASHGTFSRNTADYNSGVNMPGIAFHAEGASYITFAENTCIGQMAACFAVSPLQAGVSIKGVAFVGNRVMSNATGSPITGIYVFANVGVAADVSDITISGNTVLAALGQCVGLNANTAINPSIYGVAISGNTLANCTSWGIEAMANATFMSGVSATGNAITNTAFDILMNGVIGFTAIGNTVAALSGFPVVGSAWIAGRYPFAQLPVINNCPFCIFQCLDCTVAPICAAGGAGHLAVGNGANYTCQ